MKDDKVIEVASTDKGFEYWRSRPYLRAETVGRLANANVLIVPYEDVPSASGPVFSNLAPDLLDFIKVANPGGLIAEICIAEEDFQDLLLHGRLISLGKLAVAFGVAPLLINLLSNYVQKKLDGGQQATVRCEITVVEAGGRATKIAYNGPAETFERLMNQGLNRLPMSPSSAATSNQVVADQVPSPQAAPPKRVDSVDVADLRRRRGIRKDLGLGKKDQQE